MNTSLPGFLVLTNLNVKVFAISDRQRSLLIEDSVSKHKLGRAMVFNWK